MAAGKPLIALVPEGSDTARLVRQEGIGWVAAPDDAVRAAELILSARDRREDLAEIGSTARRAAEARYSPALILDRFDELISQASR
jgi:glycosyltransferase involved in cell wall biosynthesis